VGWSAILLPLSLLADQDTNIVFLYTFVTFVYLLSLAFLETRVQIWQDNGDYQHISRAFGKLL
jgi:hypothetical protein